jgi:endonuclease-8
MPEGDAIHRAARRLRTLVGERLEVEAPHPRARAAIDPAELDGRVLEEVDAVGKNLVLRFEGGIVLRSHLRMSGRWSLRPRGEARRGTPWLVLRGRTHEGVLWNGPVLDLNARAVGRLGPDILARPPDLDAMLARLRASDGSRPVGEALLDQRLVSGIGNMWLAEALWEARLSPWRRLGGVSDEERRSALQAAARLMGAALDGARPAGRNVYRRAGRPCPRCATPIRSRGLGDANRTAFWCPTCQPGPETNMGHSRAGVTRAAT